MRLIVQQEELRPVHKDLKYHTTSVLLYHSEEDTKNFRCNNCGKLLFQYDGKLGSLKDDGAIPENNLSIDVSCHRCKVIYRVIDV